MIFLSDIFTVGGKSSLARSCAPKIFKREFSIYFKWKNISISYPDKLNIGFTSNGSVTLIV